MCEGRPVLPPSEVHAWAAKFGLCADGERLPEVQELPSYDDLNFHICTDGGEHYVLKAHNGTIVAGAPERLLAQNRFIERLMDRGIPVPRVVLPRDGEAVLPMACPGAPEVNQRAHVRVLTYLQGSIVPIATLKSDGFLRAVGVLCGRMTRALAGFEDEGAAWDWDWNMKNVAAACTARVHHIPDSKRRVLAQRLIESYGRALPQEVMEALPHSVIHSDLNDTNLLWEGEQVVGVLDFGDSIRSCTVFEPGVAAGYCALGQEDPLHVLEEVLRGYLRKASLSEQELEALYHVAYGRVLLSVCFSAESCAAEPDNEYLAHTSEPGWAVLTKLEDVSPTAVLARFRVVAAEVKASAFRGDPPAGGLVPCRPATEADAGAKRLCTSSSGAAAL